MSRKQPNSSTTYDVYEHLRTEVLSTRLRPGARLKIAELCARLDVSLGAVREALSRLASEGLVIAEPQRGFRVAPISAVELRDLTTVRVDVESLCLRRAIALGDTAWEARIVAAFRTMSRVPERQPSEPSRVNEAWTAAHRAFHHALVDACDSPWLLNLRETLYAQSERYRQLSSPLAGFKRDSVAEHRQIMDTSLARCTDLATSFLSTHLLLTTQVLIDKGFAGDGGVKLDLVSDIG